MLRIPFVSRRASGGDIAVPEAGHGPDIPWWVPIFTDWGRPLAAVVVLVLCAPGEQHLAYLAGWNGDRAWLSWGWAGLLSLYAGISAVVATVRPRGARGKATAVVGAGLSLLLAMAAQPVSHMFTTGWLSAEPRPPLWLVVIVSGIPPFILGHLLHLAASPVRPAPVRVPEDTGQDIQTPVATVTRLRPRPVPSPVPAAPVLSPVGQDTGQPVSRPSVPAASNVLSLTKGTQATASPGQTAGQNPVSLSARAAELWLSGWDKDKIRDTLKAEYVSPDGTPPKPNSLSVAIRRAEAKHPRP
jgi:hypothetical protein